MSNETRPQDRPYRKQQLGAGRVVSVKLEVELLDSLETVREDLARRDVADTVRVLLEWATWAHSVGRNPFNEMRESQHRSLADWTARIRARHEARELHQLYRLGEDGAR